MSASGTPATMTISPETKAALRQPNSSIAGTTIGCMSPPAAVPVISSASAIARWRWNQCTTATVTPKCVPRLDPIAITRKAR